MNCVERGEGATSDVEGTSIARGHVAARWPIYLQRANSPNARNAGRRGSTHSLALQLSRSLPFARGARRAAPDHGTYAQSLLYVSVSCMYPCVCVMPGGGVQLCLDASTRLRRLLRISAVSRDKKRMRPIRSTYGHPHPAEGDVDS